MSVKLNPFTGKFDLVADKAADISIADAGGYYTGTNVEAALQEIGADLAGLSPAGNNTEVQYNDNGAFGANAALTFDAGTGTLSATILDGELAGANVSLVDAGGYFTTDNAEAALQQLGASVATLTTRVPSGLGTNRLLYAVSDNITSEAALTYDPSTNEMVIGSGQLLIGDTSVITTPDKQLHIVSDSVSAAGTDSPGIYLETTDTTVFANNVIGSINVYAGEAGGRGLVGQLLWKSNGTWTDTASTTDVFLSCTPSGALAIDAATTLVMKGTGGLGWGTDNPRSKFHIVSANDALLDLDNMNRYTIGLSNELDTNGKTVSLGFSVDATFTTVGGAMVYERTGDNSQGRFRLYTKQDATVGNPTEALRLEDNGTIYAYGNTVIGSGAAGVDYSLTFDGETNDGVLTWMEDEDYFDFADDIVFPNATATGFVQNSVTAGITASTTQSQGQGALTTEVNEVSTVANANDTVTLPTAVAGRRVEIFNNGANTLQIFPASGDNLGAGLNASTTLLTGRNTAYRAYNDTDWEVCI